MRVTYRPSYIHEFNYPATPTDCNSSDDETNDESPALKKPTLNTRKYKT